MYLEILLSTILILLLLFHSDKSNYWRKQNVPSEYSFPFVGSFLKIAFGKVSVGKHIEDLYHKYNSPYFGIYSLNQPYLVLKDPDLINRVLIKDFSGFSNRFFVCDEKIDFVMSNSLLGIKDPHWKSLRVKLSPVFTSGKMKAMLPLVTNCGENLKNYIETIIDCKIEGKEIAAKYTTDVIATCAYGIEANSFLSENSEFRVAGRSLTRNSFVRAFQALSYSFAPFLVKIFRFKFFEGETVQFLKTAFQETMTRRLQVGVKRNDLIDVLVDLKNQQVLKNDFVLDDNRLIAQAILFFFAGHEATSSTISFTLHELCIHTDIQAKLRNEINVIIRKHNDLTYEALREMNYLHMVVSETLRKYPVTPFLQRECTKTYQIPETGLVLEKGTPVIIPQHGLQWDEKYFPEPEKFDPERFSEKNKGKIPHGVYLPFGDGPRNCIGKRFAFISVKIGLIYIVRNFKIVRNCETQDPLVFPRADLLQTEKGIRLSFQKS